MCRNAKRGRPRVEDGFKLHLLDPSTGAKCLDGAVRHIVLVVSVFDRSGRM